MRARFLVIWIASVALLSNATISKAENFVDIVGARPCSSIAYDRVGASGNCKQLSQPKGLSVVVQAEPGSMRFPLPANTKFGDATPSSVTVDGLMLYNGSLAPEVLRLDTGDVLDVKLVNKLPSGERGSTNLHTHGLLVSPHLACGKDGRAIEPVGDNVFVCTVPAGETPQGPSALHCGAHNSVYGKSFSEMNYQVTLRRDHPEGLFWYHPHVHMNARTQVGAGMSGLIYVQGRDPAVSGGARLAANHEPPFERFMMLKDIQFGTIDTSDPNALKASFLPVDDHDARLCERPADAAPASPPTGACFGPNNDVGWLFTVNGQVYPHLDVAAGRQEIWRIANTSADMTYDLALVEAGSGRPLRLRLLARDGVAAAAAADSKGPDPMLTERVLMMPGSRIEVGVDRATAEGQVDNARPLHARLRSYGFFTGVDSRFGDAWPAVDLAEVLFDASPEASAAARGAAPGRAALQNALRKLDFAPSAAPLTVSAWKPDSAIATVAATAAARPNSCAVPAGHSAHLTATAHRAPTPADGCEPALKRGEERIVALAIDKSVPPEKFKIGLAHARRADAAAWNAAIDRAIKNAHQFGAPGSTHVCARAGEPEVWTIVNRSATTDGKPGGPLDETGNNETHNFHIHQMKFEVLNVVDPHRRVTKPRGDAASHRMVDSYPVPIGGELRVRMNFTRQQVGGHFVFHCHILEHEDKGMMAEIEVKDPR
jgi:FtsP/CotA-like multicopper oxidase with cupredoxin domain